MSSTDRQSSAGSSMFIRSWVKNKFDNSGFDPSALSPPTHDGEFFYVRFPKSENTERSKFGTVDEVISIRENTVSRDPPSTQIKSNKVEAVQVPQSKLTNRMGMEDAFRGDATTSCGASVVAVAQKMVSGNCKPPLRGFTTDDASEKPSGNYLRQRRNSKSLPASPLMSPETSPRTRRKNATSFAVQNRYLTGSITPSDAVLNESEENLDKKSGSSWLLSGLFSNPKENRLSPVKIQQNRLAAEDETNVLANKNDESCNENRKADLNVLVEVKAAHIGAAAVPDRKVYMKKRSEIRELNFISPVSM